MLFQWVNPKALVLAISAAGAYIAIADSVIERAVIIVGVFFAAGVVACTLWLLAGDALNRYLSAGRTALFVNAGMGLLLLLTAAQVLLVY